MDPYDSPLNFPIVVPKTHSSIPHYEPVTQSAEQMQKPRLAVYVQASP